LAAPTLAAAALLACSSLPACQTARHEQQAQPSWPNCTSTAHIQRQGLPLETHCCPCK
jgi:hypothetical protein